ncbi:hypothetical protein U0070_001960, partial [Myodes glareolus]
RPRPRPVPAVRARPAVHLAVFRIGTPLLLLGEPEPESPRELVPGGPGARAEAARHPGDARGDAAGHRSEVLPSATMTEGTLAADEVRVPLGASPPAPAAPARASPASPGAPGREEQRGSGSGVLAPESPATECGADLGADEEQPVPYPALAATVFFCLGQTTRPRSWCLRLVCNPYPYRVGGALGSGVWDFPCVRSENPGFWYPARAGWGCEGSVLLRGGWGTPRNSPVGSGFRGILERESMG